MTRPAGVTPRGLPYPGSVNIHAETPVALQSLAEAISAQLTAIGSGQTAIATFTGLKSLGTIGTARYGRGSHTFAELATVEGCVGMVGPFIGGGVYRWGWVAAAYNSTGNAITFDVIPVQPQPETFAGATVAVCLFAWGARA